MIDPDPDPPLRTAAQLAAAAWLGAERAIGCGRSAEAERWLRLHLRYRVLAKAAETGSPVSLDRLDSLDRPFSPAADGPPAWRALSQAQPAPRPDSLDSLDRSQSAARRVAASPPPEPRPPP